MLVIEAQETIARFIGYFVTHDFDLRLRSQVKEGEAPNPRIELSNEASTDSAALAPSASVAPLSPHIAFRNDRFEIEPAGTHSLRQGPVELEIDPLRLHHPAMRQPDIEADLRPAQASAVPDSDPVPQYSYEIVPGDSLLARITQNSFLDDRDTLIMGDDPDALPLDRVDAIARDLADLLHSAKTLSMLPAEPGDAAAQRDLLRWETGESDDIRSATESEPGWHEGVWLGGEKLDDAPDLKERLADHDADMKATLSPTESGDGSWLVAGSNTVINEAHVTSMAPLAPVSVVQGDWFETNSIRQINLVTDHDRIEGIEESGIRSAEADLWNLASFRHPDATPGAAPMPGIGSFPVNYRIDVMEGDLQITNILRQVAFVRDGDSIVLSATESRAQLSTGGNENVNLANFAKLMGSYDLVVIGGSVYEGNFIQQINILSDSDTILGAGGAVSVSAGGNLLVNNAAIVNAGAVADFKPLTAEMSELVARFSAGETSGPLQLGADLAFIGGRDIHVLYIKGDVLELNVVSQTTILEDSDTVRMVGQDLGTTLGAGGSKVDWSVSTGGNKLVNNAVITDADDAAHHRFIGGEYYSHSMLAQADFITAHDGIQTFDTSTLVPAVIAFVSDLQADTAGSDHAVPGAVAHHMGGMAEGLAGILS